MCMYIRHARLLARSLAPNKKPSTRRVSEKKKVERKERLVSPLFRSIDERLILRTPDVYTRAYIYICMVGIECCGHRCLIDEFHGFSSNDYLAVPSESVKLPDHRHGTPTDGSLALGILSRPGIAAIFGASYTSSLSVIGRLFVLNGDNLRQ